MICECRSTFQKEIASLKEYINDAIATCKQDIVTYKQELEDLRRKMSAIGMLKSR